MARGTQYWYDLIVAEKENQDNTLGLESTPDSFENLLNDLTSASRVSIWRLWAWVIAYMYTVLDGFWDLQKADVDLKAASAVYANDEWWVRKTKAFQYGDNTLGVKMGANGVLILEYDSTTLQADADRRIVKYAAITSSNGASTIKAAKDVSGFPAKLAQDELRGLTAYAKIVQPAGVNVTIVSNAADLIKYRIDIYYDAIQNVNDITLGTVTDPGLKTLVTQAILNYHSNLRFDGEVQFTKLTDYIQAVSGVQDVKIVDAQAKPELDNWKPIDLIYYSKAGFVQLTNIADDPSNPGVDETVLNFLPK